LWSQSSHTMNIYDLFDHRKTNNGMTLWTYWPSHRSKRPSHRSKRPSDKSKRPSLCLFFVNYLNLSFLCISFKTNGDMIYLKTLTWMPLKAVFSVDLWLDIFEVPKPILWWQVRLFGWSDFVGNKRFEHPKEDNWSFLLQSVNLY
jgi:hypothetical protein